MVNDPDAKAAKPTRTSYEVSRETRFLGEEDDRRKLDAKSMERDLVFISHKKPRHRLKTLTSSRFDFQTKRISVPALEDAVRSTRVQLRNEATEPFLPSGNKWERIFRSHMH